MKDMLRSLFAVAALAAATMSLSLSGCAGNGRAGSAGGPDTLVFGRNKDAVRLDPAIVTDGNSLNVSRVTMEGLTQYAVGSFEIAPCLATSWTASPDGKTWRFHLRHNVTFQDNTPFNADSVKFNFDRWRLKDNPWHKLLQGNLEYSYYESQFGGFPGAIKDVKVLGPDQVEFDLSRPVAPMLANLAMPAFGFSSPTAMKKAGEDYFRQPIGTGPYQVTEWQKDDHITLTAYPGYWGAKPKIQTIILRDIPDAATSMLALQKGDLDGWEYPRPDDMGALQSDRNLSVYHQPPNNLLYLAINTQKAPFDNVLVRRNPALAALTATVQLALVSLLVLGSWSYVRVSQALTDVETAAEAGAVRETAERLRRRYPAGRLDRASLSRLAAALARRGFDHNLVRAALREIDAADSMPDPDDHAQPGA